MGAEAERILYHTAGCHLCELAEAVVAPIALARGWSLSRVDIAGDEALLERYGTRIPVLRDPAGGREIGWPFDAAAIERALG